jgi:Dna[CI] antecedent, DciA
MLINHYGLSDDVRQIAVCLFWPEIVGARFASRTTPLSFTKGVLEVSAASSPWVQEMRFFTTTIIALIHAWIDANQVWLGPPPLVKDIRFGLGTRRQHSLVDPADAQRLRLRGLPTVSACNMPPPTLSDANRDAIRAEASAIADPELRAEIESLRLKWDR